VPPAVRALRGATTIDEDTAEQIKERVVALLDEMLRRNGVDHDDLISIWFTATDDIHSTFPATAARSVGLGDVPLICARELDIVGGTPRCIRVLMHLTTERTRGELRHVYLEGAKGLRDDLPG
jgi:chorismate mutase